MLKQVQTSLLESLSTINMFFILTTEAMIRAFVSGIHKLILGISSEKFIPGYFEKKCLVSILIGVWFGIYIPRKT